MIEWQDPPAVRVDVDWQTVADALREHPGKWARVAHDARAEGTRIRRGNLRGFGPYGSFEARSAQSKESRDRGDSVSDRRFDTWARYVGPSPLFSPDSKEGS